MSWLLRIVLVLSLTSMAVVAPWAVDLKYVFVPGSTAEYTVTANAVQVLSREGGDLPETVSYTQTYGIENHVVGNPAPGQGRVETTFESLNVQMTAGGATTTYNSETAATPPNPFLSLAALVGQKYSVDVTEKGSVVAVTGLAELQQHLLDADPSSKLTANYDMNTLVDNVTTGGSVQLPAGSVTPGATWTATQNVATPFTGSMIVSVTFTYTSDELVGGLNTAKLDFQLSARTVGQATPSQLLSVAGTQVETRTDMNLSGSGTLNLALAEGLVVKMNWTGRLVTGGAAAMLAGPTSQVQQTTSDTRITQTMELTGRS